MRRKIRLVLVMSMLLALSGCKKEKDRTAEFATPEPTEYVEKVDTGVMVEEEETEQPSSVDPYSVNAVNEHSDNIEQDSLGHLSGKADLKEEKEENEVDFTALAVEIKHKAVSPSLKLPYKNKKGWYLVDTDGDFVGDSYWKFKKSMLKNNTKGIFYQFKLTDSNNKVDFIIACQNYKQGYGEIIDFK